MELISEVISFNLFGSNGINTYYAVTEGLDYVVRMPGIIAAQCLLEEIYMAQIFQDYDVL